jgi:ERCC4-type nuclease
MALPGVGRKHGKLLMSKYDNICELCGSPKKELQKILGPKKGETIYNALRK